jgi:DNA-binding MarR family transcriptional regulator
MEKIDIDIKNNEFHPNRYGMYIPFGIQSLPKETLPDACKLLLCRIKALSKKKGYCYEYNIGLAHDLGKAKATIPKLLAKLKKSGYIRIQGSAYNQGHEERRHIYLTDKTKKLCDDTNAHIKNETTPHINNDNVSNKENLSNTENKRGSSYNDSPFSFEEIIPTIKCSTDINNAIIYYLNFYQNHFNQNHPRLRRNQWERVVNELSASDLCALGDDSYTELVQNHFATKYADGCNYHITHFASQKIIENRSCEIYK